MACLRPVVAPDPLTTRRRGRAVPVVLVSVIAAIALTVVVRVVAGGGLDCSELPPLAVAEQALADHPATKQRVEAIHVGYTQVAAGPVKGCPGRGRIEILHATEADARDIRRLLGPTFHGAPYRLVNI